jgi:SNF family Na+-dependent transporter
VIYQAAVVQILTQQQAVQQFFFFLLFHNFWFAGIKSAYATKDDAPVIYIPNRTNSHKAEQLVLVLLMFHHNLLYGAQE